VNASIADKDWDVRAEGRSWTKDEAMPPYVMIDRKIEMVNGMLSDNAGKRGILLCLPLENIGAGRAVQFGNSDVWRAAAAKLERKN
jgi:hypothetical protein